MRTNRPCLLAALMIAGIAAPAVAQATRHNFDELLKRLPDQANALVLVDVDALFDSPLGRSEKWRERSAERPTGVLGVSADAARFVVAAGVDLSTAEERWKVAMLATHANPPSLKSLSAREGGYVEQIEKQDVAWTPRNFYLMSFPERIVGFAVPTDRQLLSGWMKNLFTKPRTFPPGWADRAFYRANGGVPIVLALNLEKSISAKAAESWLREFESENVQRSRFNFDLLASRLADAKSVLVQIDVKNTIEGTIRIEFAYSVELLRPIAKELLLDVLSSYGADVEDIRHWGVEVKDTAITLSGRMSEASVRRFLSFAAVPQLSSGFESPAPWPPPFPIPASRPSRTSRRENRRRRSSSRRPSSTSTRRPTSCIRSRPRRRTTRRA